MNQVRITKTRSDALSNDYAGGVLEYEVFSWSVDALIELGVQDDPCPYTPRDGFRWWEGLPLPPPAQ